jgi:hypothetical protein
MHENSLKNLRPWHPGQSGNPTGAGGGRPRFRDRTYQSAIAAKKRPNARIRRAVRREFITRGQLVTVRQVLERAFPRLSHFRSWHYHSARRALRQSATIVARSRFGSGRPALWAQKSANIRQILDRASEVPVNI